MATDTNVQLTAQCLCKRQTFTESVARSLLPFETGCCHCNSCRRTTGGMFTCIIPWSGSHQDIWNSSLKKYTFTSRTTLLFCGVCSSPMFFYFANGEDQGHFEVNTGVLPNIPDLELIRIRDHLYVEDTLDGGASIMMRRPNSDGKIVPRWKGMRHQSDEIHQDWPTVMEHESLLRAATSDEVAVSCHCGGVNFTLHWGKEDFAAMQRDALPYFVDPKTHKLLASFDACDSCRLACGTQPVYWISSLLKHMWFTQGEDPATPSLSRSFPQSISELKTAVQTPGSKDRDSRFGTLAVYSSSKKADRYFCSKCSASIFYTVDKRPDVIDVTIGVLHSPSGARAESMLEWNYGMMGYMEDVAGSWRESLMSAIKRDSEEWRVERGIPKSFRRIVKEEEAATVNS